MVSFRKRSILFLLFISRILAAQQIPPTERLISIDVENMRTDEAFWKIAEKGKFDYSYGNAVFDPAKRVSLHLNQVSVRRTLDQLFNKKVTYKVRGNHIILVAAPPPLVVTTPAAPPPKKREYQLSGYIIDARTGKALPDVTVYDTARIVAVLTDAYGHYTMTIPGGTKPITIKVSKGDYQDTVVTLTPTENAIADLQLQPKLPPKSVQVADTVSVVTAADTALTPMNRLLSFRRLSWVDSLLSRSQQIQFVNLKGKDFKGQWQVSFVPYVSTNGILAAKTVNRISLNVLGGYTGGTNGVELGGLMNIDRGDVRFLQLAGFGNIVAGNVEGMQASGFGNAAFKNVKGIQMAGSFNFVNDTMDGLQLSGGINYVNGHMKGIQGSNGLNIVRGSAKGVLASGGGNFVLDQMHYLQLAGGFNYAGSVKGAQIAGGINIGLHDAEGFQLSGFTNYASNLKGWQVTGATNIVKDSLNGVQISGLYNHARYLKGMQLGLINRTQILNGLQFGLINFADTCTSGVNIGLLSFVRTGVHQIELSANEQAFFNLSLRTGLPQFYNSLLVGIGNFPEDQIWSFGYGIGTRLAFNTHWHVTIDAQAQHVNAENFSAYASEWVRLIPALEWAPVRKFSIAAGPSLNWYFNQIGEEKFTSYIGTTLLDERDGNYRHRLWIGGTVALRFF